MQPSFGLVTVLTPQSHRMAEGGLWGGPGPVTSAELQAGASPLPAALRIPNSPSKLTIHGLCSQSCLGSHSGLSTAPVSAPVSLGGGTDPSPLQEPPVLLPPAGTRVLQFPQEEQGLESANSNLRLLLPVEGLILFIFPLKHHLSLPLFTPELSYPQEFQQGQLPFLIPPAPPEEPPKPSPEH